MTTKVHKFLSGVIPTSEHTVFDLPVGVYSVRVDSNGNFFLESTTVPSEPTKIYGEDTGIRASRYLETFKASPNKSLGALLIGEPGSGKTMLIRKIINQGLKDGITVILVEQGFNGASFNKFIHESLRNTSAIIVMDEFEKMYNMDDDEVLAPLLTLFDGPSDSHKFFLCSANDRHRIAAPFFNRPSRFYYIAEFGNISNTVIKQYIDENLHYPELSVELFTTLIGLDKVNFDCLVTAVREVNRCKNVEMAFMDLNIKDKYSSDESYVLMRVVDAETGVNYRFDEDSYFHPKSDCITFYTPNTNNQNNQQSSEDESDDNRFFGYVERTVAPMRVDGCYIFAASCRGGGPKVNIYVQSHNRAFAF